VIQVRKEGSGLTSAWLRAMKIRPFNGLSGHARMAELADAPDSKSGARKSVGVRPSLWAPSVHKQCRQAMWDFCMSGCSDLAQTEVEKALAFSPVDMFESVAYSPTCCMMKKLQTHDVSSNIILVGYFGLILLNLTEEAAHA
jgi:hypothetical protein